MPTLSDYVFYFYMDRKTTTRWKAYQNDLTNKFYWRFTKGYLIFAKRCGYSYKVMGRENAMQLNLLLVEGQQSLDEYLSKYLKELIVSGVWDEF